MEERYQNKRLRRLIWIVRSLQERPMSLQELNNAYRNADKINCGESVMERRTFINDLHAIGDMFNIDIECNRRNDYKYEITDKEDDRTVRHIIANIEQSMALGEAMKMGGRVLVEQAPGGREYLGAILDAMEKSRNITITFQDFNIDGPFDVTGAPYALKLYQNRWYVIIKEEESKDREEDVPLLDTYCLDRITHLRMEKTKFHMDPDFNAEDYFRYSFGVRVVEDEKPMLIHLKVAAVQRGYFRSLPLHHSQKEIEKKRDYSIFTIEVVPTIELMMKILSYGSLVEVIAPIEYRKSVMNEVKNLYVNYF